MKRNHIIIFTTLILMIIIPFNVLGQENGSTSHGEVVITKCYSGMMFRETPYANMRGTRELNKEDLEHIPHFKLDYDSQGRLIGLKYMLNGKLKPFANRFVRAPFIKINYLENKEVRTFYNELGHRTLVSGDVYKVIISYDDNGRKIGLKFYGINNEPIENDFAIASYQWQTNLDGTVIEKRYDIEGKLQRNRPGFGYYITKFHYNHRGFLCKMVNLGHSGVIPTTDEAGVVSTKINYDNHGRFTQWLNLDKNDQPIRGMSNIAEIKYIPSPYSGEQVATFIDQNLKPQTTNWGAHKVKYDFDSFGNEISRVFIGINGTSVNTNNGVGIIKSTWNNEGLYRVSRSYYNKDNQPVGIGQEKIHQFKTEFDIKGRPISTSSYNVSGQIVFDSSTGFAIEKIIYDEKGRLTERQFLNVKGKLVNHSTWEVARFEYNYIDANHLKSVKSFNSAGKLVNSNWDPKH